MPIISSTESSNSSEENELLNNQPINRKSKSSRNKSKNGKCAIDRFLNSSSSSANLSDEKSDGDHDSQDDIFHDSQEGDEDLCIGRQEERAFNFNLNNSILSDDCLNENESEDEMLLTGSSDDNLQQTRNKIKSVSKSPEKPWNNASDQSDANEATEVTSGTTTSNNSSTSFHSAVDVATDEFQANLSAAFIDLTVNDQNLSNSESTPGPSQCSSNLIADTLNASSVILTLPIKDNSPVEIFKKLAKNRPLKNTSTCKRKTKICANSNVNQKFNTSQKSIKNFLSQPAEKIPTPKSSGIDVYKILDSDDDNSDNNGAFTRRSVTLMIEEDKRNAQKSTQPKTPKRKAATKIKNYSSNKNKYLDIETSSSSSNISIQSDSSDANDDLWTENKENDQPDWSQNVSKNKKKKTQININENINMTLLNENLKNGTKKITKKYLQNDMTANLFKLYNDKIFNNQLPKIFEITWSNRLNKTAGYCQMSKKPAKDLKSFKRSANVKLGTKIVDTPQKLRDTLLHELCHAASFIIDNIKDGHGKNFKRWAKLGQAAFPEIPMVTTCHNYEINYKFNYICSNTTCHQRYGRHSKMADIDRKRCGVCKSSIKPTEKPAEKFIENAESGILQPVKSGTSSKPKKPNAFALFVKEKYKDFRTPGTTHGQVMVLITEAWHREKMGRVTASQ